MELEKSTDKINEIVDELLKIKKLTGKEVTLVQLEKLFDIMYSNCYSIYYNLEKYRVPTKEKTE